MTYNSIQINPRQCQFQRVTLPPRSKEILQKTIKPTERKPRSLHHRHTEKEAYRRSFFPKTSTSTSFLHPAILWKIQQQSLEMSTNAENTVGTVSISTLLKRLSTLESARSVSSQEIAAAVALVFSNSLSPVQFGVLLWALHTTNLDHSAEVLAACASSMRANAAQVDEAELHAVVKSKGMKEGSYGGGLVSCNQNPQETLRVKIIR